MRVGVFADELPLGRGDAGRLLRGVRTGPVDRAGAAMLDDLLAGHLKRGGAAIVATHLPVLGATGAGFGGGARPRIIELG